MRTVFFLVSVAVAMFTPRDVLLRRNHRLNALRRSLPEIPQLFCLPSVQSWRDGERRIHSHHARIEVEFGHALQAARRTLLDAHATAFAVINQNLIQAVRTNVTYDAGLRTDQVTIVTSVAGAATETATGLFHRLLFRERLNHFVLCFFPGRWRQQRLLNAR